MTKTQTRTVLIRTIEATARLIDGSKLAIAENDEGRMMAALQRPAANGKPAKTIIYIDPDNHDWYSGEPGDIGRLLPDPSWLDDQAYVLTRALAHLTTKIPVSLDDLRPAAADADDTREPGTARIRIPSTMRAMQVGSSAFGRPFRCILLSASQSAAQTTVAVLAGTQAGSNPDIREVEDEGS